MAKKTYSEKLKDPRWQKLRLRILERDKWECQQCGDSTEMLAVHHLEYKKDAEPWDYEDDQLLTLCNNCHSDHHKNYYKAYMALGKAITKCGFSTNDIIYMAACFRVLSTMMPKGLAIEQVRSALCYPIVRPKFIQEIHHKDFDSYLFGDEDARIYESIKPEYHQIYESIYGPDED